MFRAVCYPSLVWRCLLGSIVLTSATGGDVTRSTSFLTRGPGPPSLLHRIQKALLSSAGALDDEEEALVPCDLNPRERAITFSHPASIDPADRFFFLGSLSYEAIAMVVDYINNERCGVVVNGERYAVVLQTMGDNSDGAKHAAIARYFVNRTDFFLAGYTSAMTRFLAPVTQEAGKLMVAGGSSRTSIYRDRDLAFGILPPSRKFFQAALEGVFSLGARTLAIVQEESTAFCDSLSDVARSFGIEPVALIVVPAGPSLQNLTDVAYNMSQGFGANMSQPDVVASCLLGARCPTWIQAMRLTGWSPKAQIFGICGALELEEPQKDNSVEWYQDDVAYMMVATAWSRVLPTAPDNITGWTPAEFATAFERRAFATPVFQIAAAATSLSVMVQAIERANSLDTEQVRQVLATQDFPTMFGNVSFDENGQNRAIPLLLQFNKDVKVNVVFPQIFGNLENANKLSIPSILYPMPTWNNRDCELRSLCGATDGVCSEEGLCICNSSTTKVRVSLGIGSTARCRDTPEEDMMLIGDYVIRLGTSLMSFQIALSLFCIGWTVWYRNAALVKASQPFFLILVAVGTLIMVSSIYPLSFQGAHRYELDATTCNMTTTENPEVERLDWGCMAFPWFVGLGFALMFAALFAKIWRIRLILDSAAAFRRHAVRIKDVLYIVIAMLFLESSFLLVWNSVAPLRWEREILLRDKDGCILQSFGSCTSKKGREFYMVWGLVNGLCLVYALWLSFTSQHVSDDYSEHRWIRLSVGLIFQVLILSVPVLFLAGGNVEASYLLFVMVVFSVSALVSLFIFVPHFWRLHKLGASGTPDQPLVHRPRRARQDSIYEIGSQDASRVRYSEARSESVVKPPNASAHGVCSTIEVEQNHSSDPSALQGAVSEAKMALSRSTLLLGTSLPNSCEDSSSMTSNIGKEESYHCNRETHNMSVIPEGEYESSRSLLKIGKDSSLQKVSSSLLSSVGAVYEQHNFDEKTNPALEKQLEDKSSGQKHKTAVFLDVPPIPSLDMDMASSNGEPDEDKEDAFVDENDAARKTEQPWFNCHVAI